MLIDLVEGAGPRPRHRIVPATLAPRESTRGPTTVGSS
jgi:hypothetical protein